MPSARASSPPTSRRVSVLLPLPLAGAYDYRLPDGIDAAPGDFVVVPLGRAQRTGVVWGDAVGDLDDARLKDVTARLDVPPMAAVARDFVDWVARYTVSAPGAVLKMAMSVPAALETPRPLMVYAPADAPPEGLRETSARRRVLAVLAAGPPLPMADLTREAGVGAGVVKAMVDAGALTAIATTARAPLARPDGDAPGPMLAPDQRVAAEDLCARARADAFSVVVLDGVPGSGKTEVYFEAVAETLRRGRQALVLLPEIALTAQWMGRFRARFGAAPAIWHSELSPAARRDTWRDVAEGRASVVVGARSALFLPFADLGLIVVDEEHDAGYKQEEGVVYNARDMAVVRGRLGAFPVVLASATPSLESIGNARAGRYVLLSLPERHGGAAAPEIAAVDMRAHPPERGSWLSPPLVEAMGETLGGGGQAMLFLNRRGYAPLTLCRACGHRMRCPRCTAWLVEHRRGAGPGRLLCHHCGFATRIPETCPACEAEDRFVACGPGVERLAEEVAARFPDARFVIAASDTITGPAAAEALVRRIEGREIDIVIGTQILAKGYHFPLLTLVGVVDADLGLSGGDLRAAERTYQILYQVAGRAGRESRPGRVLLQTFEPGHPVMRALLSGERDVFLAAEAEQRRLDSMPPYGRLVALIVSDPDETRVDAVARELARAAPRDAGVRVLGPSQAPLAVLRGRHRRRFLLKAPLEARVQGLVRDWVGAVRVSPSTRIRIDIDPYGFL